MVQQESLLQDLHYETRVMEPGQKITETFLEASPGIIECKGIRYIASIGSESIWILQSDLEDKCKSL